MTLPSGTRDAGAAAVDRVGRSAGDSHPYVVAIGIDRYQSWGRLQHAARDACGARDAFVKLGFRELRPPLLDDAATADALQRLVTDDLRNLGNNDSVVVFFAGHGHTETTTHAGGTVVKRGYLVPVNAGPVGSSIASLVNLENWLHELANIPAKHLLVVIDACHSGIALSSVIRWRGEHVRAAEPLEKLRARRSRRIITSALDSELAMDSGPIAGHSLFTGCLIQALDGGLHAETQDAVATGSEVAQYVQRLVQSYPRSAQTPDFGALELDDRGELIIPLLHSPEQARGSGGVDDVVPRRYQSEAGRRSAAEAAVRRERRSGDAVGGGALSPRSGVDTVRPRRANTAPGVNEAMRAKPPVAESSPPNVERRPAPPQTQRSPAEAAFIAALERHQAERLRGSPVLTLISADPMMGMTAWASWAASRGHVTLVTETTGFAATTRRLLEQMPWLRILASARTRLATAAQLDVHAIDQALDARSPSDCLAWVHDVARHDMPARVGGWLLSMIREPWGRLHDLTTAPLQGGDLLAALCELDVPVSVVFHHEEATAQWLERAIETATELIAYLPGRATAVSAPSELMSVVIHGGSESAAVARARRGEVSLSARSARVAEPGHVHAAQALRSAFARDGRLAGAFEPGVRLATSEREVEVDLLARRELIAIAIDDWYQFRDPTAYERDRSKDRGLSKAQYFVMRFLTEDIDERIGRVVDEVAMALAARRASGSFVGRH